jgi:pilus assembly protein Flp/PilA
MKTAILEFLKDEDGPTSVEYALLIALIAVNSLNILNALGHAVSGSFSKVNSSLGS